MSKQVTIYRVDASHSWEGEADSTQDAVTKATAYIIANMAGAEVLVTSREVWIEEEQ